MAATHIKRPGSALAAARKISRPLAAAARTVGVTTAARVVTTAGNVADDIAGGNLRPGRSRSTQEFPFAIMSAGHCADAAAIEFRRRIAGPLLDACSPLLHQSRTGRRSRYRRHSGSSGERHSFGRTHSLPFSTVGGAADALTGHRTRDKRRLARRRRRRSLRTCRRRAGSVADRCTDRATATWHHRRRAVQQSAACRPSRTICRSTDWRRSTTEPGLRPTCAQFVNGGNGAVPRAVATMSMVPSDWFGAVGPAPV